MYLTKHIAKGNQEEFDINPPFSAAAYNHFF